MWCIAMGLTAAALALPYARHRRRRAQRVRIDLVRSQVERWLSAPQPPIGSGDYPLPIGPQQPDGSPVPPTAGAVRCRHRVVLSDPDLSATLSPGWRLR